MRKLTFLFFGMVFITSLIACNNTETSKDNDSLKEEIVETEHSTEVIIEKVESVETTEQELDALLDEL